MEPAIIGAAEYQQSGSDPVVAKSSSPMADSTRKVTRLLALTLLISPLLFGSVHPLPFNSLVVTLCGALFFVLFLKDCSAVFAPQSASKTTLCALMAFLLVVSIQTMWRLSGDVSHPILAGLGGVNSPEQARSGLLSMSLFVATFTLCAFVSYNSSLSRRTLRRAVLSAGVISALVALSHWFSDNGMLFWVFAPENIVETNRARWPFVNPNHLGHFLLPISFLLLGSLAIASDRLLKKISPHRIKELKTTASLLRDRELNRFIFTFFSSGTALVIVTLCFVAALSRSTWLGITVALVVFQMLSLLYRKQRGADSSASTPRRRHQSTRRTSPSADQSGFDVILNLIRNTLSSGPKVLFLVLGVSLWLFIRDYGAQLFHDRIVFGLLHSFEDIRLSLLADSGALFKNSPIMGIGLGNWSESYPQVMSPQLSGINPEYLHSEPFQLLIEVGVVGILPVVLLVGYLVATSIVSLRKLSFYDSIKLNALLSGLIGLGVASCFDFTFRVPAILVQVSVLTALICYYIDKASTAPSGGSENVENETSFLG